MSVLSKEEIQRITADTDIKIEGSNNSKSRKRKQSDKAMDYPSDVSRWSKFNFGIVSVITVRFLIIIVTAISLMQLERTL